MCPFCSTFTDPRFQSFYSPSASLYLLPLHPHHRVSLLAVSLSSSASSCPLTPSGFFNGMLGVSEPKLLYFILPYLLNLICNLNSSSFFQIPGFSALRSDRAHSQSGLFLLMPCTIAAVSTFSSSKVLSFCALSTISLSLLDPNSNFVQVNPSLNNSSSFSFILVHSPAHASFYFS